MEKVRIDLVEILDEDQDEQCSFDTNVITNHSKSSEFISLFSSNQQGANQQEWTDDLLALSFLRSQHLNSDELVSSEGRFTHSKLQRLYHFLTADGSHEPISQALGDNISTLAEVDDALVNSNRNATLKLRNYRQCREQRILSLNRQQSMSPISNSSQRHNLLLRSKIVSRYFIHSFLNSLLFKWLISIIVCLDVISVAITTEYSSSSDAQTAIYHIAVVMNRCIVFIYVLEVIFKWIDDFINFWYSPANVLEFILTCASLSNLISEFYLDTKANIHTKINMKIHNNDQNRPQTLQHIKSYGLILSLLRILRMLRILRLLEIAFRFAEVRIVFLALSRSVRLIFHVVILTVLLNYLFAIIALYLTQFGLNTASNEHRQKINALFGTLPRAFITVFRIFTKDEWFEIKTEMYALQIKPIFVDLYILSWLFFGGYVLNPLLIGALVNTFDQTRKELKLNAKQTKSKNDLSLNQINRINIASSKHDVLNDNNDDFNEWLQSISQTIQELTKNQSNTQWSIYIAFCYLQLLEVYFENIAERQLLFDFISIYLLSLHDKEMKSINPPILSSDDDDDDDDSN